MAENVPTNLNRERAESRAEAILNRRKLVCSHRIIAVNCEFDWGVTGHHNGPSPWSDNGDFHPVPPEKRQYG
jgi:hypothetical protein